MGEQRVGIQRDRRKERIELCLVEDALGMRVQRPQGDHQTKQDADSRFHAPNLDLGGPGYCINV